MDELTYLSAIAEELHKLNENISFLEHTINDKFGGIDTNNLNVTLFTDDPIMVTTKDNKENK